jgi:hypothetical protein
LGLIQAFVREGFDFARHPLSLLANGPGGWVQTANFALTGLMVVAAAVGFKRVLGPRSLATSAFLGFFGVCMIVAAVFPADPMDGFPVGTPVGAARVDQQHGADPFPCGFSRIRLAHTQLPLRGASDVTPESPANGAPLNLFPVWR